MEKPIGMPIAHQPKKQANITQAARLMAAGSGWSRGDAEDAEACWLAERLLEAPQFAFPSPRPPPARGGGACAASRAPHYPLPLRERVGGGAGTNEALDESAVANLHGAQTSSCQARPARRRRRRRAPITAAAMNKAKQE